MTNTFLNDASLLASLASRTRDINIMAMEARLPGINYPEIVPVNTNYADWQIEGWSGSYMFSGKADWITGESDDVPKVALAATSQAFNFSPYGVGYSWDMEEVGKAADQGVGSLTDLKARGARRKSEEFAQNIAFNGDARKGYAGIINQTGLTTETAVTAWVDGTTGALIATPDEIYADFQYLVEGPLVGAGPEFVRADTVGLAPIVLRALQRAAFDPLQTGRMTIADYVETSLGVRLVAIDGLATAGAGGDARAIGYLRDISVIELPVAFAYRLEQGYQFGPFKFNVPGWGRLGGVQVHNKDGVRYLDGVTS